MSIKNKTCSECGASYVPTKGDKGKCDYCETPIPLNEDCKYHKQITKLRNKYERRIESEKK